MLLLAYIIKLHMSTITGEIEDAYIEFIRYIIIA